MLRRNTLPTGLQARLRNDLAAPICLRKGWPLLGTCALLLLVSAPPLHAVSPVVATSTTLTVVPGTGVTQGTALTLQAAVVAESAPVTQGSVTFYDGSRVITTVQVVSSESAYPPGTANFKLYLGPGSHVLSAVYSGTKSYWASTSQTVTVTVNPPAPTATSAAISSSGGAGNYTLQGQVAAASPIAPTGVIAFLDRTNNSFSLGTSALSGANLTNRWQNFTSSAAANANYAVVIGDLNGDGIPDLVSSNYTGTSVSVFLGNGDGTFQAHVDYEVGSFPFGMALGDLNGDGIPDLAVAAHNASTVQVLLGNGDGTFQAAQSLTTAGTSQSVAMADFNGDGILDLVTCSGGGSSFSVLLGNGDGTFQTQQSFGTGSFTYGPAVGDFNNDGWLDVAVSNNDGNSVSIFLGNGDGTFQAPANFTVDSGPTTIAAADLNADGNLDLVVGDLGGSAVSVLLGNGDGTFQSKVSYSGFATPWGVAVVDVNADGVADIVAAGPNSHAVEIFVGNGDGTFQAPVTTSTGVTNYVPALADLNGDGVVDLVVPNITSSNILVGLGSLTETAALAGVSIPGGGTHGVVASYAGDTNFSSSASTSIGLTGSLFVTTLALNAAPASVPPGQTVVLTADISPWSGAGYTAGGTVTFFDGGTAIGAPVGVSGGAAALSKSDFSNGSHSITANYSGDNNFIFSNSISNTPVRVTYPQTITFSAISAVTFGTAPLTLSATASSGLAVSFSVISGPGMVSSTTDSGTTLTVTGAGSVVIEADQGGDSNYEAATPVQHTLTVNKAASAVALTASSANVSANASVTFTATVSAPSFPVASAAPSGSAMFLDGSTQLATVAFNAAGVATYSTAALAGGTHSISASYTGNGNFLASSSAAVSETVVAPDYAVAANPSTLTIQRGNTGSSVLTVTPTGGFTGQVAFACTTLPQYTTCSFVPATVMLAGDNAAQTVQFALSTVPAGQAAIPALTLWPPLGMVALLAITRRRKPVARLCPTRGVQILVLAGLLFGMAGCGGSTALQVPLGTSMVTMTATTVGGSAHHAASIRVTITQ